MGSQTELLKHLRAAEAIIKRQIHTKDVAHDLWRTGAVKRLESIQNRIKRQEKL